MSRIGFLSTLDTHSWGGSEVLWYQTAMRLASEGQEIGACLAWWPDLAEPVRKLQEAGIATSFRQTRPIERFLRGRRSAHRFHRWLDRFSPDLVVISIEHHATGHEWMHACAARGIPYVIIVNAVAEHLWPPDPLNREFAKGYREAAMVAFVSAGNRDFVRIQLADPLINAEVVRNPLNVDYDAAPPWPSTEGGYRLACVGRIHPASKGQDLLFSVLSQDRWKQRDIHIDLFGQGEWMETLIALKELHGLQNVSLGHFSPDVESIWRDHHALILPSRYEGVPQVTVEAMLCGRPCIVTDLAGNTEFVDDNETGFLAAAPTERHLDEAMERAWQRRGEWETIGAEAARRSRERIPRDPVQPFIQRIVALANGKKESRR